VTEVTVIIPVYNAISFIDHAVKSILNQTLKNIRLLIINDGSTDGTLDFLNGLTDKRVQVVHQSNRGQGFAKNVGLTLCNSTFVAMMDADDVSFSSRLAVQLRFLRTHKEIGMVGTQIKYISTCGHNIGLSPPLPNDHETIYADLLRGRHAICQPTLMCRTSILKRIGGFRIDRSGEDLDMWLRMGEASRLANLDEVLFGYRIHLGSVNARHMSDIRKRYAYAIHCAKRRKEGRPELPYDEFLAFYSGRPFYKRVAEVMDIYASGQYRHALIDILNLNGVRGYARLALASLCSPPRTLQRISRALRRRRKT